MKQGRAPTRQAGQKREPIPHAMSPAGVAQIGKAIGGMRDDENITGRSSAESMNAGRGYSSPKSGANVHHSGTQGRHK